DFKNTEKISGEGAATEVENYIIQFEPEIQEKLRALRQLFLELLPGTEERISYKIPAYRVGKHYLYFAAYKTHIGLYPAYGLDEIENEITPYRARNARATLHFMHTKPLPLDLIRKIIKLKSKA